MGLLPDTFDVDAARRVLSASPTYHTIPLEPGLIGVAVNLTVHARLPAVPDAYLEWRWDEYVPEWSWEPMIRGFRRPGRAAARDLAKLISHGKKLFEHHQTSRGREPDDPVVVCTVFKESLPSAIARAREEVEKAGDPPHRDLRQREVADVLGISVDTLSTRMKDCTMP
jgi:hypothetical protein